MSSLSLCLLIPINNEIFFSTGHAHDILGTIAPLHQHNRTVWGKNHSFILRTSHSQRRRLGGLRKAIYRQDFLDNKKMGSGRQESMIHRIRRANLVTRRDLESVRLPPQWREPIRIKKFQLSFRHRQQGRKPIYGWPHRFLSLRHYCLNPPVWIGHLRILHCYT